MPSLRAFVLFAIVLSLLAGGLAPRAAVAAAAGSGAEPAQAVASADGHAACHGGQAAPEPSAPPPAGTPDCCDDAGCTCSCLHHAPVVFALAATAVGIAPADQPAPGPAAHLPGGPLPRQLRPPIA